MNIKLYARPSFLEGMARLIDVGGVLNEYNYSESDNEADYQAMLSDWESVGSDIRAAMKKFDKEANTQIVHEKHSET